MLRDCSPTYDARDTFIERYQLLKTFSFQTSPSKMPGICTR